MSVQDCLLLRAPAATASQRAGFTFAAATPISTTEEAAASTIREPQKQGNRREFAHGRHRGSSRAYSSSGRAGTTTRLQRDDERVADVCLAECSRRLR